MKKIIFIITVVLIKINLFSQTTDKYEFLWPITDAFPGDNIILFPTDMIFNNVRKLEHNYNNYLIGGELGDPVVAVADGVIIDAHYGYSYDFLTTYSTETYKEIYNYILKWNEDNTTWIYYSFALKTESSGTIGYSGLQAPADITFKTGQNVKRGQVIGAIGNMYESINKPGIELEYTYKERGLADIGPKLLGIDNNLFQENYEVLNYKSLKHPVKELKELVDQVYNSLTDVHPAIYEYISKKDYDIIYHNVKNSILEPLTSDQFYKTIIPLIKGIKDNHTNLYRNYAYYSDLTYSPSCYLPIKISIIDNKCYIIQDPVYDTESGSEILSIDGDPIEDIIDNILRINNLGDGGITELGNEILKYGFTSNYILYKELTPGKALNIKYKDGVEKFYTLISEKPKFSTNYSAMDSSFKIDNISDDIIKIKIKSMSFTDVEKSDFTSYFKDNNLKGKTIILDLKYNLGGVIGDSYFIYSFFVEKGFYPEKERKVNNNNVYETFKHSLNYSPESVLYTNYKKVDGREGFYLFPEENNREFVKIEPVTVGNFNGEVYVLTNGTTGSAALELATYFRAFNRGTIIGTEGSGNFYKMSGLDFVTLKLGNTELELTIPLIQTVKSFDIDDKNPINRGLIPDHIVSDSIADVLDNRDATLEYTLELMEKTKQSKKHKNRIFLISALILVLIMIIRRIKKSKYQLLE